MGCNLKPMNWLVLLVLCAVFRLITVLFLLDSKNSEPPSKKKKDSAPRRSTRLSKISPSEDMPNVPSTSKAVSPGPSGVGTKVSKDSKRGKKNDQSKGKLKLNISEETDKLIESENLMEFVEHSSHGEMEDSNATGDANLKLECLGNGEDNLGNGTEEDSESLSKVSMNSANLRRQFKPCHAE